MNFDTNKSDDYLMTVNGLSVGLNMPKALESIGKGADEHVHSLPEYKPRKVFLVDEYPACPSQWLRSSGRIKSYFVAVRPNSGLWLDFNACFRSANNVAIVVSVQGVNAVTGLPCKDSQLEQYRDCCPKHKEPFGPDRLCKKCNFKWPKQNYLAGNVTPVGNLWLDGFRAEDGVIRQYVFTEQKIRGVAAAVLGEERVHALGISYYLSKEPKPKVEARTLSFGASGASGASACCKGFSGSPGVYNSVTDFSHYDSEVSYSANLMSSSISSDEPDRMIAHKSSKPKATMSRKLSADGPRWGASLNAMSPVRQVTEVKKLEVAAGARIDQRIYDDTCDLEFWQKEPEGLIVINYCTEEDAEQIIAAGKVDLSGSSEGFLSNVPTGNP